MRTLFLTGAMVLAPAILAAAPDRPVLGPPMGPESVARLKGNLDWFMKLPEDRLLALVPDRSGFLFVGCPNCAGGSQENQLTWRLEDPDHVICRFCGHRYPSEKYPDTKVLRVTNPLGRDVEYPYWEDAKGYRYFFQARKWYIQRDYFAHAAYEMAIVAHHTGDAAYARRAALILDAFARAYPGYCVTNDYPGKQKSLHVPDKPPYPYWGGRWNRWFYCDIPSELIRAYDLLRPTGALQKLAQERGEPVAAMQRRIEEGFFRAAVAFVRTYPVYQGNMDPCIHTGMVAAGRVLGEPEYVHEAVKRIAELFANQFFADGAWREGTTSYHNQTIGGLMEGIRLLKGYSDPPAYHDPQTGRRFDGLDLAAQFPIIGKAERFPSLMCYPNGRTVPVHDAWPKEQSRAYEESGPLLLPALGHARLGTGKGAYQAQAHLHFAGGYGHQHLDLLSLTLFGAGKELLSDIGYTHTRYRAWSTSTLAHNTVVVDGKEQAPGGEKSPNDGSLRLFAALPGVQVVEAEAPPAYPGLANEYRRLVLLVAIDPEHCYVLDLFRVTGGKRHDYAFHGDADGDMRLETPLALAPAGDSLLPPGVSLRLPRDESDGGEAGPWDPAYGFVKEVRRTDASTGWQVTLRSAEGGAAVRLHGLPLAGTVLLAGTAPSLRRAGDDDSKLEQFRMPVVVLRRDAGELESRGAWEQGGGGALQQAGLRSEFAVVMEPYAGKPAVERVEALAVQGGKPGDVAVRVTAGPVIDTILCRADDHAAPLRAGGVELAGHLGLVRERAGKVERLALVGGTRLRKGRSVLKGPGVLAGSVVGTRRKLAGDPTDALVVEGRLPEGSALAGQSLIITHGDGFRQGCIVRAARAEGQRTLVELEDDPGFSLDAQGNAEMHFFPRRKWKGPDRFEIAPAVERQTGRG